MLFLTLESSLHALAPSRGQLVHTKLGSAWRGQRNGGGGGVVKGRGGSGDKS